MSTCSCSLDREDPREGWIECLKMQRADFMSHLPLPSSGTQVESWRHLDNAFCFSQPIACYIAPLFLGLLDFSPEIVLPEYYNKKELGGGRVDLCLTPFFTKGTLWPQWHLNFLSVIHGDNFTSTEVR